MGPEGTKWERNLPPIVVSCCVKAYIDIFSCMKTLLIDEYALIERSLCSPPLNYSRIKKKDSIKREDGELYIHAQTYTLSDPMEKK
jgi:hypothetical protein